MSAKITDLRSYIEERIVRVPIAGCWLWTGCVDNVGYPVTGSVHFPERKIHRLSWHCYHHPITSAECVLHKCDIPSCVNPDHLFLGTQIDNMEDRKNKGRNMRFTGERHGNSKLTTREAIEIKQSTMSATVIAQLYEITRWAVYDIRSGRTWPHI